MAHSVPVPRPGALLDPARDGSAHRGARQHVQCLASVPRLKPLDAARHGADEPRHAAVFGHVRLGRLLPPATVPARRGGKAALHRLFADVCAHIQTFRGARWTKPVRILIIGTDARAGAGYHDALPARKLACVRQDERDGVLERSRIGLQPVKRIDGRPERAREGGRGVLLALL